MKKLNIERYCQFHKNNLLEILHLSKDDQQHELCSICYQIDEKFQKSQIVFLNHILKAEQDTIITNLPPFEDKQIHPFLSKQFYSKANQIETKIEQINTYFENLKTHFDNTLKKVKVEMYKKIEILQGFKQNLIDTYNQVSSKEQLQNLYLENPENLSEQVHDFISLKFEQIKSNTEKMQQSIKEFNSIYDNLSEEQPNQIRDTILNLITKIDFFSSFQIEEYVKLVKQHKGDIDDDENNIKLNADILIDLISNKTNYCSEDFIVQLKQIFNKYELLLNSTKINCKVNDKQKKDCFQNLNDQQLGNIRLLSEKIQLIEKEYNNNKLTNFSEKIQPNSNLIINDLNRNFWNETNLVQQTFKKFPIFELDDLKNIILSQKINFIKSQYSRSQQDQEISFVNGKIQILKINKTSTTISYSNIKLDVKNKYIIRLHIQTNPDENNPFVLFGLIEDNKKDNDFLSNSKLTYNERNGSTNTLNKIIKGNVIAQGSQKNINKQIEIRVHLEDKLIRVATYPDYQNVSELDDKNKIQQNIEYRFATELYQLHDKLTINEIFVVDQFDNNM